MTEPTPGWYPDPANGNRKRYWSGTEWTSQTQGGGMGGLPTALLVGGGLLVLGLLAGGAIALFSFLGDDSEPAATSTPTETTEPVETTESAPAPPPLTDVETPDDWVATDSAHGSFSFARGPEWEDLTDLIGDIDSEFATPGIAVENGGAWLASGTLLDSGTIVIPIALSEGKEVTGLKFQMIGFRIGLEAEYDEIEEVASGEFTTAQGYEVLYEFYTARDEDLEILAGVYAFAEGETLMMVTVTGDGEFEAIADELAAHVNSYVINGAPQQ